MPDLSLDYWFLVTLFKISIIFVGIAYLSSRFKKLELPLIILVNIGFIYLFVCRGMMPFIWFYSLGYLVQKYDLGRFTGVWTSFVAFMVFAFCSHLFVHDNLPSDSSMVWIEMGLSLMAIIFCYYLFRNTNEKSVIFNKLKLIGKYTLGIYLLHNYLLKVDFLGIPYDGLSNSLLLVVFIVLGVAICFVCIGVQRFMEQNRILAFVFYGKKYVVKNEKV